MPLCFFFWNFSEMMSAEATEPVDMEMDGTQLSADPLPFARRLIFIFSSFSFNCLVGEKMKEKEQDEENGCFLYSLRN